MITWALAWVLASITTMGEIHKLSFDPIWFLFTGLMDSITLVGIVIIICDKLKNKGGKS